MAAIATCIRDDFEALELALADRDTQHRHQVQALQDQLHEMTTLRAEEQEQYVAAELAKRIASESARLETMLASTSCNTHELHASLLVQIAQLTAGKKTAELAAQQRAAELQAWKGGMMPHGRLSPLQVLRTPPSLAEEHHVRVVGTAEC